MDNNNTYTIEAPLYFDTKLKMALWYRLRGREYIKYQRWGKDEEYIRFRIHDNSYKIVVSPSYKTTESLPVYYGGADGACWLINATQWYDSLEEIMDTVVNVNNYLYYYTEDKFLDKMQKYSEKHNIDPRKLEHNCVKRKNGGFRIYFTPDSDPRYDDMAEELAKNFMEFKKMKDDKFGTLFQVMRYAALSVFGEMIISEKVE